MVYRVLRFRYPSTPSKTHSQNTHETGVDFRTRSSQQKEPIFGTSDQRPRRRLRRWPSCKSNFLRFELRLASPTGEVVSAGYRILFGAQQMPDEAHPDFDPVLGDRRL